MRLPEILNRPLEDRQREFRYRFAQSFVFGVPVLALQWFGPRLGGAEAPRWIAILQTLLTGWIVYIAAAGMLFEGLVARSRQTFPDALVAGVAVGMYLFSAICVLPVFFTGRILPVPLMFHFVVLLLIAWTGIRWCQLSRHSTIGPRL